MVNASFHTIVFQPSSLYGNYLPTVKGSLEYTPSRIKLTHTINQYFFRALSYIQHILRLLQASAPFFEQYGPVLKEMPKMYKIMKVLNELKNDNNDKLIEGKQLKVLEDPKPRLFI